MQIPPNDKIFASGTQDIREKKVSVLKHTQSLKPQAAEEYDAAGCQGTKVCPWLPEALSYSSSRTLGIVCSLAQGSAYEV